MPNPTAKPIQLVKGHRTKAEIEQRTKAEESIKSGLPISEWPEVKKNKHAHETFERVISWLDSIEKNDIGYESVTNRYCILMAECKKLEKLLEKIEDSKEFVNLDRQLMAKRRMMLDIEKENMMTLQSGMRAIPKKPEEKKPNPMAEFLARQKGG